MESTMSILLIDPSTKIRSPDRKMRRLRMTPQSSGGYNGSSASQAPAATGEAITS